MNRKRLLISVAAAFLACSVQSVAGDGGKLVAVRGTPGVPDSVIAFIAQISEPQTTEIPANVTPKAFIEQICGIYTMTFGRVFHGEVNKTISQDATPVNRSVKMPACVKWQNDFPVRVRKGETLDDIVVRRIGLSGSRRLACAPTSQSIRCNKTVRELVEQSNPGKNLDQLKEDDQVILPFATFLKTFTVRKDAQLTPDQVALRIIELARQGMAEGTIINSFVAPPVRLLAPVSGEEITDEACKAASKTAKVPWPYDVTLVDTIIKRNYSHVNEDYPLTTPVTVAVIDTGIDASFPKALLRLDPVKNSYGLGTFLPNNINPFPDHEPKEQRLHGTQVAEILTGGPELRALAGTPSLKSLFKINIVNAMQPTSTKGQYQVTLESVNGGADWAAANALIANVSIGSESALIGLQNAVIRQPQLLLVAAAGNEAQDLEEFPMYPANFGGVDDVIGTQVITVAAHNANFARAPFSNRGKYYVDLFAPGCDIPYKSDEPGLHGTSFAAPIVSMTAALLRAFGVKTPKDVKWRLRVSLDYDEDLHDLVLWSGRLNIPKALSLHDDVLQRRSGELAFGRWQTGGSDVCSDKSILWGRIRKITALKGDPFRVRVLYATADGKLLVPHECKPASEGLIFADEQDAATFVPWSDFGDLVVRHFPGTP